MSTTTHILMNRNSIEDADQVCIVSFTPKGRGVRVVWTAATRSSDINRDEIMTRETARKVWRKLMDSSFEHAVSVPGSLEANARTIQNLPIFC